MIARSLASRQDLVRLELQVVLQTAQDGRIVFDDENAAHKVMD
jgi:hypothetical protein